ncbi:serine hydrolase [Nocardia inohanensis]|uniref:serine hydrolase n=1 Tax=Nocardia inohanensis TaxID=209246 RepID=UPI000A04F7F6|nr:serine hydrolase [Nocardia inohanensis]
MTPRRPRSPYVRWLWLAAAAIVALLAAKAAATENNPTGPIPLMIKPPATIAPAAPAATELAQRMREAIRTACPGAAVGIDVVDLAGGTVIASLDASAQFYTASVVKLLIALDALKSADWQPDSAAADLLTAMLSTSDDDIADALWDEGGRGEIIERMTGLIGLPGTIPPDDLDQWGETRTTPRDVVTVLTYLSTRAPAAARDLILTAMRDTEQVSADGTDQFFGIPDALPGHRWAVKQGWMYLDDSLTLATTGLVAPAAGQPLRYAVVILTTQPVETPWADAESALTAAVTLIQPALI